MKFFSVDNPVWRFIRKIGYLWILNILWVVTSLPLVTVGASTTALIFACMKLRDDEGYPVRNYFRSFKDNFRQATVIWLIYVLFGAVLVWGLIFWNLMDGTSLRVGHAFAIAILIPYALSLLYVFAVQAKFVNSVRNTIHYALILPFKHFGWTIQMAVLVGVVIYLNVTTIVLTNFLTLTVGIGWMAYLLSIYYMQVFDRYIPKVKEESEPEDGDGTNGRAVEGAYDKTLAGRYDGTYSRANTGADERRNTGADERRNTGADERRNTGADERRNTRADERRNTGADERTNTGA